MDRIMEKKPEPVTSCNLCKGPIFDLQFDGKSLAYNSVYNEDGEFEFARLAHKKCAIKDKEENDTDWKWID